MRYQNHQIRVEVAILRDSSWSESMIIPHLPTVTRIIGRLLHSGCYVLLVAINNFLFLQAASCVPLILSRSSAFSQTSMPLDVHHHYNSIWFVAVLLMMFGFSGPIFHHISQKNRTGSKVVFICINNAAVGPLLRLKSLCPFCQNRYSRMLLIMYPCPGYFFYRLLEQKVILRAPIRVYIRMAVVGFRA